MKYQFLFVNADPSRVTDAVMADVVQANLLQQVDLADAYGLLTALVSEHPAATAVPASTAEVTFVPVYFRPSTADDPSGAVAFHWVAPAVTSGNILWSAPRPECHILTDVVASLSGPGDFTDKLATSASHECCEAREDTYADDWADLPDGRQESLEVCDRVQCVTYGKKVASGRTVQVSDFLFASAFTVDPLPAGTKVDFCGALTSDNPRAIAPDRGDGAGGGYAAIRDLGGNTVDVQGDRVAAARYSHKTMAKLGIDLKDAWETLRLKILRGLSLPGG